MAGTEKLLASENIIFLMSLLPISTTKQSVSNGNF